MKSFSRFLMKSLPSPCFQTSAISPYMMQTASLPVSLSLSPTEIRRVHSKSLTATSASCVPVWTTPSSSLKKTLNIHLTNLPANFPTSFFRKNWEPSFKRLNVSRRSLRFSRRLIPTMTTRLLSMPAELHIFPRPTW